MSKKYVVGLDLGGTKIYTALVDLNGTIIKEKVVETLAFEGEEAVINRMMDTIDYVIEGTDKELIKAIGIGAPGALDLKEGIVIESPNLPFENFELVGKIRARYDLPTYLDNDGNAAHKFRRAVYTSLTNRFAVEVCPSKPQYTAVLSAEI